MQKNIYTLLFILILLFGILLRFWGLDDAELGADAIDQIYRANNADFISVLHDVGKSHQGAAPLDFLILHYWIKIFRETNFTVQIPAVIFGCLTLIFTYFIGIQISCKPVALWGIFLLAISTFHIYFCQEARYYSLSCLMSAIILWAMIRAIEVNKIKNWVLLIIVSVIGFYAHFFTIFILLIGLIWVFLKILIKYIYKEISKSEIKIFIYLFLSIILSFLLFLPWFIFKVSSEYKQATSPFGLESIIVFFYVLAEFTGTHFINRVINYPTMILGLLIFFIGCYSIIKRKSDGIILVLGIPIITFFIYLVCFKYVYYPTTRQWLVLLPWFLIIESEGIYFLQKKANILFRNKRKYYEYVFIFFMLIILSYSPFIQFKAYKETPSTIQSIEKLTDIELKENYKIVGVGLSADNAVAHIKYYLKQMKYNNEVFHTDDWLRQLEKIKSNLTQKEKIIFISTEKKLLDNDNTFYFAPWTYYFPNSDEIETMTITLKRFIDIQQVALTKKSLSITDKRQITSEVVYNLALAYKLIGNKNEYIRYLKESIKINPLRRNPRAAYAKVLEEMKNYDEAEKEWRAAIEGSPPAMDDRISLGTLLLKLGRISEAEEVFKQAIKKYSENQWILIKLREALIRGGKIEEAEEIRKKISAQKDLDYNVKYLLGLQDFYIDIIAKAQRSDKIYILLITLGFFDDDKILADRMFDLKLGKINLLKVPIRDLPKIAQNISGKLKETSVVFAAPENIEDISSYKVRRFGELSISSPNLPYMKISDIIEDSYKIQLELHNKHKNKANSYELAWNYVLLSNLTKHTNNHKEKTIEYLNEATSLQPNQAFFWLRLGQEYLLKKDYNMALKSFKKAEEIESNSSEVALGIAKTLVLLNKEQDAKKYFEKAILKNPEHEWAIIEYAELLEKIGDNKTAIQYWERAEKISKFPSNSAKAKEKIRLLKMKQR